MHGMAFVLAACLALPARAEIVSARYAEPTTRYAHGVLGDAIEYGALDLRLTDGTERRILLPESRVFEDIAPRLADLDGDGAFEVITVESDRDRGARLAVHGPDGLIVATPFIGRTFRWLAPVGAADLDGDGAVEIAYVDRPHLARILRVWRFADGRLLEVAQLGGVTNHRIGDAFISGGMRDCGAGPEMLLADADWAHVVAVRMLSGALQARALSNPATQAGFAAAAACR